MYWQISCCEERLQFIYTLAVLIVQLALFQVSPQKRLYFLPRGGESLGIRLQFKTLDAHFHCAVCSARTQLQKAYQYIYCVQTITTACCLWFPCRWPPENYHSPTWGKGRCSWQPSSFHRPIYWNKLPVEAYQRRWEWCGDSRGNQPYTYHLQCAEVRWRELPLHCQQLCW